MMSINKRKHDSQSPHLNSITKPRAVKLLNSLSFVLLLFTVAACGGGGSSESTTPPVNDVGGNADPIPDNDDIPANDDNPPVGDGSNGGNTPLETHTISGELSGSDVLQADSDVNDPFTAAFDNNNFDTAQVLPNPVIVKGYATATATGVESDHFANTADEFDVFRISAFANQSFFLEIADFDPDTPGRVDLDIGLFDESRNLLLTSLSTDNSFESLVIPADGEYFLAVNAFNGGSNYTLTLSTEFATAEFDSQFSLADLRLDQLTLTREPRDAENLAFVSTMRKGLERQNSRVLESASMMLQLNEERIQKRSASTNSDKRRTLMSIQTSKTTTQKNNGTLDPLSMLEMIKVMNSKEGEDIFLPMSYPKLLQADFDSDPIPNRFLQWNLDQIGWNDAQDRLQNISLQKRPILAVIDGGFFVGHPDLAGVLIDQRDFVPAIIDGDGLIADASEDVLVNDPPACHGFHGTHVATIAAAPQNNTGITGVAPGIGIMGIKLGHSSGSNCGLFGSLSNAILYAAGLPNSSGSIPEMVADVINLSLGSTNPDPETEDAIQRAAAEGVIIVAAAGNNNTPVPFFPAAHNNVISVAATDTLAQRAPYSSFYPQVDIAAPGGDGSVDRNADGRDDLIFAGVAAIRGSEFQAEWGGNQGTSMASPTVAAGIAIMKGIEPSLTQRDVETMLAAGELTLDIGAQGFDNELGFGLMSLPKMIESAVQFSGSDSTDIATIVTSTLSSLNYGASLDEISFELVQSGSNRVSVESISATDTLALPDGTFPITFNGPGTPDGFGMYTFALNRSVLDAGVLSGALTFNLSNETTYVVPVSAVNQLIQGVANSAAVFFIVDRLNSDSSFETVEQFFTADGVRQGIINAPELEEGTYRMIYGTDTDNDGLICDEGELCGFFPFNSNGFSTAFVLNDDISDATYLLENVGNVALSTLDGTLQSGIEPRIVIKQ